MKYFLVPYDFKRFDIISAVEYGSRNYQSVASSFETDAFESIDVWKNAKEITREDFPLYFSSMTWVTLEFEDIIKGRNWGHRR